MSDSVLSLVSHFNHMKLKAVYLTSEIFFLKKKEQRGQLRSGMYTVGILVHFVCGRFANVGW